MRVLGSFGRTGPSDLVRTLLPLPSGQVEGCGPRIPEAARFLEENTHPDSPTLLVTWGSGLHVVNSLVPGAFTAETFAGVALSFLHQSPMHLVFVGTVSSPITESLRPMASLRLRLLFNEGRVFVQGIRPRTPSLALTESGDREPYQLLRVV